VPKILIIDDDQAICSLLTVIGEGLGHEVTSALTLKDGLKKALAGKFAAVLLDVRLPDGNGLYALPKIKEMPEAPEVIIITGAGDADGAELAIKNGAWDYLEKPSSKNEIALTLTRVLQYCEGKKAIKPQVALKLEGIEGQSPKMRACLDLLAQAAACDANVLITGETGTGKELFAAAIHRNSSRAQNNFVVVDCTALPETLVESILFGHEKGAFTGADKAHEGLVKQADGGTLFLDEVGELPLVLQKAFLRVLQERRFRPLGSRKEIESDFRLIAATNRDLNGMAQEGQFRQEFLFRLQSLVIELPPLRERPGDIKTLAMFYLSNLYERYGVGIKGMVPEFLQALEAYEWPGNVRELFGSLEQAVAAAYHEPTLFPTHLPQQLRINLTQTTLSKKTPATDMPTSDGALGATLPPLRDFRENMEKHYLQTLMSRAGGNIPQACAISGLSRAQFYLLLKKHNLSS
jgi:two-component system NtrC family response regulator